MKNKLNSVCGKKEIIKDKSKNKIENRKTRDNTNETKIWSLETINKLINL